MVIFYVLRINVNLISNTLVTVDGVFIARMIDELIHLLSLITIEALQLGL